MTGAYDWSFHISPDMDRKTVLFLHGFMGCQEDWKDVNDSLRDTFRVMAVDLPGHGLTHAVGADASYGMAETARALTELLDSQQVNKCHLVGYSMGGRLALYLAVTYPDRFDYVVLESASPGLEAQSARTERVKLDDELARKLETVPFDRFLDDWYTQPLFATLKRHPRFQELLRRRAQNRPDELAKSLRQMGTGTQPSLWESLKNLRRSALFLAGSEDIKFREIALQMASRCPAGRVAIIENAGHTVHFEQPELYIQTVRSFFSESR
ncbi:MAG: 2-succinyl-6-hydroxy-2,4-cyclohexadiene-1-carboxylate synthase [Candidatus Zixiibacteriota bacterium]